MSNLRYDNIPNISDMYKMTYPLVGLLAASACTSHRHSAEMHRETIHIDDSARVSRSYGSLRLDLSSLWAGADSTSLLIEADSAVVPDGTRLYRPRLRKSAHAPRVTSDRSTAVIDSGSMTHSNGMRLRAEAETLATADIESRTATIRSPYVMAVAALLASLAVYAVYARRRRSART